MDHTNIEIPMWVWSVTEIQIICHCPATKGVLQHFTAKFYGLTRLLDLPTFASFTPDEMTRMVLGNPPPQVL